MSSRQRVVQPPRPWAATAYLAPTTAVAPFDAASVSLVAMPLFHIAGSGWGIVGFLAGGTNVLMREVDPAGILQLVPEHGVTNALFVPAVLQFLLMGRQRQIRHR